ncbi:hypothetical protein Fmac_002350 [Flemingia macrophylla]|uniref:Glycosyl hydrolases family 38 C-terminal beta sandwich domain-containing protein n=1 Tax=Flemingia macrophylla TaxID=520843 RepID=A0ABD1NMH5_9FABA
MEITNLSKGFLECKYYFPKLTSEKRLALTDGPSIKVSLMSESVLEKVYLIKL